MGLCIACETLLLQELGWCLPYFLIFFCGNISIPADALYREQYGIIHIDLLCSSFSSNLVFFFFLVVVGDLANVVLDPIFIFVFRMGVSGAAIAHVISQ